MVRTYLANAVRPCRTISARDCVQPFIIFRCKLKETPLTVTKELVNVRSLADGSTNNLKRKPQAYIVMFSKENLVA